MSTSMIVKSAVVAGLLACSGASFSAALTALTPQAGSFAALAANTDYTRTVDFEVLPNTTGFSALVQTTWSGALNRAPVSFSGWLTGPGGYNQVLALTVLPITQVILGQPRVVGGIELLRGSDATLAAGDYTLHIMGKPKQVSTVSYNLSVTTPVPEPETAAMLLAGLGALGFLARRRRQD